MSSDIRIDFRITGLHREKRTFDCHSNGANFQCLVEACFDMILLFRLPPPHIIETHEGNKRFENEKKSKK